MWGLSGLEAHFLGSPGDIETNVGVGIDEIRLKSNEAMQRKLDDMHQQVLFLMQALGLKNLDAKSLEDIVKKNPSIKPRIDRLKEVIREYQSRLKIFKSQSEKSEQDGALLKTSMEIHNRIYSKVCLYHGEHRKLIKKTSFEKRWRLLDNELVGK